MTHADATGSPLRRRRSVDLLEWLTLVHVAVFLVAATWAFGGQSDWVRGPLTAWGTVGGLITLAAVLRGKVVASTTQIVAWAAPVVLFNALVLIAAANPNLREMRFEGDILLVPVDISSAVPSSARPELARTALLQFDAIWLACFNLVLVVRRGRVLRGIFLVLVANATALAVFGTAQKLLHAPGIFFGAVPSPQKYFFSTFVYHNHWGAFALLALGGCLAMTVHYSRRLEGRDFLHSPLAFGIVLVLLIAATLPLSASRSSTALGLVLLGAAALWWLARLVRKRRHYNESTLPVLALGGLAIVLCVAAIGYLGRETIRVRAALTVQQIRHARTSDSPDGRVMLYRDTWRMAQDKRWFGWGMASYPHVFMLYNSRVSVERLPVFYHDAHSDWLQSLAEHGVVGTGLLVAAAAFPLVSLWRKRALGAISAFVVSGCGMVVFYALLEFPFGNFAVRLTWWLSFYAAVQYALLRAGKIGTSAAMDSSSPQRA